MLSSTNFGDARVFTNGVPQTIVDKAHGVATPIQGKIIGAGPITKQDGTVAHRVVLIDKGDGYCVHTQYFPKYRRDNPDVSESYLEGGDYYHAENLHRAVNQFGERVAASSASVRSIYNGLAQAV